jgi:hypothetical protein
LRESLGERRRLREGLCQSKAAERESPAACLRIHTAWSSEPPCSRALPPHGHEAFRLEAESPGSSRGSFCDRAY